MWSSGVAVEAAERCKVWPHLRVEREILKGIKVWFCFGDVKLVQQVHCMKKEQPSKDQKPFPIMLGPLYSMSNLIIGV